MTCDKGVVLLSDNYRRLKKDWHTIALAYQPGMANELMDSMIEAIEKLEHEAELFDEKYDSMMDLMRVENKQVFEDNERLRACIDILEKRIEPLTINLNKGNEGWDG